MVNIRSWISGQSLHQVFQRFSTSLTLLRRSYCFSSRTNLASRKVQSFDICWSGPSELRQSYAPLLKTRPSLPATDCEHNVEGACQIHVLRPGMVLLKHYISHNEQVELVRSCQKLGSGAGGFYQLGNNNGRHIMGLGLTWDPDTRMYELWRSVDGSKTHEIPENYSALVKRSLKDAQDHIKKANPTLTNAEHVLPSMSPSVGILNFYIAAGKLALHQDKSESRESLRDGLPIVSFSMGDSAEFLYGDVGDACNAEIVVLESGDVLIFGGKSRHIYHGVRSIIKNSAPKQLVKQTMLRPGRLNLTFREF